MKTVNRDDCFIATNRNELLTALNKKETYIIVTEAFKKEFEETSQVPLSENEKMGVYIGSGGGASILSEAFYRIGKLFNKDPQEQKDIDQKLRKYTFKKTSDNELLLYLSQLDY